MGNSTYFQRIIIFCIAFFCVGTALAGFQKLGSLVYFANHPGNDGNQGSAILILVPPSPDPSLVSGIFVAASNKYMSVQELDSLEKVTGGVDGFESAFLGYDKSENTFNRMFLQDREYVLPSNFVVKIASLEVTKNSTSQALPYISFTVWNKTISFLGFQMVANEDGERAADVLKAYQIAPGLKPYKVIGSSLKLEDNVVTEMRFPIEDAEQNRCVRQGVKFIRQELLNEAISRARTNSINWDSLKTENPADFLQLRVGKEILALGLNGIPVSIQEDPRLAYSNEIFCTVRPLDLRD